MLKLAKKQTGDAVPYANEQPLYTTPKKIIVTLSEDTNHFDFQWFKDTIRNLKGVESVKEMQGHYAYFSPKTK